MSPRPRPDFCLVRLSEAGRAFAAGSTLRIHTAHLRYAFEGTTPVEVLRSEWRNLVRECGPDGQPIFELAEPAPAPTPLQAPEGN